MAGGALERLLQALAARLPAGTTRDDAAAALRVAVAALPEEKAKLRDRVTSTSETCTLRLLKMIQEQKPAAEVEAAEVLEEPAAASDEEEEADGRGPGAAAPKTEAAAAYAAVDEADAAACVARCLELLHDALARLRPASHGSAAVEGLLSLHPPEAPEAEAQEWSPAVVEALMRLVPVAAATMASDEGRGPLVWRRLLTLLILAPTRLAPEAPGAAEAASRIGLLLAVVARPAALRSALRLACAALRRKEAKRLMPRLVPVLLPALQVAFNKNAFSEEVVTRSDLLAALHAVRFLGICKAVRVNFQFLVGEAREALQAAIENVFDVRPLIVGLTELCAEAPGPRGRALQKRHASYSDSGASRTAAASLLVEAVELLAASLEPGALARLVDLAGLPHGDDEAAADFQAIAAKARGDLFFEDAAGAADDGFPGVVALGGDTVSNAQAAAGKRVMEALEGLEDLQPSVAAAALDMGEEDLAEETGSEDAAPGRKRRLRKKTGAAGGEISSPKRRKSKA